MTNPNKITRDFNKACKLIESIRPISGRPKIDKKLKVISSQLPYDYVTISNIYEILEDYDAIVPWCNWCASRGVSPLGYLCEIKRFLYSEPGINELIKIVMS